VIEDSSRQVRVLVVGSGFSGLGAAIRLKEAGEDFVILDKTDDIGGTWAVNTYPGCMCDVPSHLYSFSFALNPHWSRVFSPQPEIWDYLRDCADRFSLRPHIRFGTEVTGAQWDDARQQWQVDTTDGTWTADVLVAGTGALSAPAVPSLPGLDTFEGKVFHSARWDHTHDLTGRRVAVIGTGASAIQFIPEIAPQVKQLTVLQRTPPWVMSRRDREMRPAEQRLYARLPGLQRLLRTAIYWVREVQGIFFLHPRLGRLGSHLSRQHLHRQVADPELRAKLTPNFAFGCKRVLMSNTYYPALARPNVKVETQAIEEVRPEGIATTDGAVHEVDTIIFGTGFHVTDAPIAGLVRGRDGRSLAEHWAGSPQAYLGTAVAGFPNLFLPLGPNTGLGHTSVVLMIESQIGYLMAALAHLRRTGAKTIEPRPEAQATFVRAVDRKMRGTTWVAGGCSSWYLDSTGRNSTLWPGYTFGFRRLLARFDPAAHAISGVAPDPVAGASTVTAPVAAAGTEREEPQSC
jgi:cation diffusion facilitator CzcD-associated flavoprotein CzcO